MSKDETQKYSSSASDGNLAEMEDESFETKRVNLTTDEVRISSTEIEKQVYFTLPRWMSGRRKSRRKIKDIKVDVPYKAKEEEKDDPSEQLISTNKNTIKKKQDGTISLFSKLFKKNSNPSQPTVIIPSFRSQSCNYKKFSNRVPSSCIISTSNTDIRSHTAVADVPDYQEYFKGKTPAVCGIKNHGNTCFMNAVIQCLSNTDFFSEYFVMDQYKVDFLRRNKIHAKKYGTKGEVTEQLATLVKSLWSCQYYPDLSYKFKQLVAKFGSQYEGSNQHDAQEFLLWLLDKVHEDLNTAPKQKYKKPKSSCGRPDEDLAAESMANHLRCNNSFIHDLFQGQFRSSLSCPGCKQRSNTFDPYLCVSLPVPHSQSVSFFVHLVLLGQDNILKIGLTIDSQATFKMVREKLCSDYSLPKQRVIITEFTNGDFGRTFSDSDTVHNINETGDLYAFEAPLVKTSNNDEGEQMILIVISKVRVEKNKYEPFWRPFVIRVPREATFKSIQEKILSSMSSITKPSASMGSLPFFKLRVIDGVPVHETLPDAVDLPLYMPIVDKALMLSDSNYNRGPKHIKLAAEWKQEVKERFLEDKPFLDVHSSALNIKNIENKLPNAMLYECFDMYFKEEKLEPEDAWMCPYCHRRLQGVKQLSLWTVPDIFIIHLKRFRQTYCQRTKVTTSVEFPLVGLDMNPYIVHRNNDINSPMPNGNISQMAMWSPWRRLRSRGLSRSEDNIYDLYAVCNHHGSMQGGHYTAYCKNPVDGYWYSYDDDKVQPIQDSEVMTANAYILFYQRNTSTHSCASSSTSGYSSASSVSLVATEHWAFRMPPFLHILPKTSKSQDNLCNMLVCSTTLDRRNIQENRPFTRAARSYSSMICFNDNKAPQSMTNDGKMHSDGELDADGIPPPPPPPSKRYWTITSV